jgi:hypothetical protein
LTGDVDLMANKEELSAMKKGAYTIDQIQERKGCKCLDHYPQEYACINQNFGRHRVVCQVFRVFCRFIERCC